MCTCVLCSSKIFFFGKIAQVIPRRLKRNDAGSEIIRCSDYICSTERCAGGLIIFSVHLLCIYPFSGFPNVISPYLYLLPMNHLSFSTKEFVTDSTFFLWLYQLQCQNKNHSVEKATVVWELISRGDFHMSLFVWVEFCYFVRVFSSNLKTESSLATCVELQG